jgi:hypothetical protein
MLPDSWGLGEGNVDLNQIRVGSAREAFHLA